MDRIESVGQPGLGMAQRRWMLGCAGAALVLLAGCGSSGSSGSDTASVRLLNASTGYPSLDLALGTIATNTAITPGAAGSYANVATSGVSTVITATGSTAALSSISRSFTKATHYTLAAYGQAGALKTVIIAEEVAAAASGQASLQMLNLALDAGSVDIYLTGSTDALADATPVATGVAGGGSAPFTTLSAGTYRLRVTGAGDKTDLRLDAQGLVLGSTQVATLLLSGGVGGVLVNSVLVQQQGTATALNNTQARVRVVSALTSGASVTAQVGGTVVAAGVTAPNIGSYAQVAGGGTVPVVLTVNGNAVAVASQPLPAGGDFTLLLWGNAAAPQVTRVVDDNRYPTVAGNAKIRLINGTTGSATALTLKADFSAVAASINPGQASDYGNVTANNAMRLDVSSGSNAALYSLTSATVAAKGLYTMYLLGDSAAPVADFRRDR